MCVSVSHGLALLLENVKGELSFFTIEQVGRFVAPQFVVEDVQRHHFLA